MTKDIAYAATLIEKNTSFLMTCHVNPDADALGSVLALGLALRKMGKKVDFYNKDNVPPSLEFLPHSHLFQKQLDRHKHYDMVFTGDSGDIERLGKDFVEFKNYDYLVNVDHHITNTRFGNINIIDVAAPSTGCVILKIIEHLNCPITPDIATCVYVTLVTDTGSFQYRNTTEDALAIASQMVKMGANPGDVSEYLFFSFPTEKLLLLKRVLNTLEFSQDKRYASIVLREADIKELNVSRDVAEDFIDHPRSLKSVRVAAYFKEINNGKFKLSLRSKGPDVDVSKICGYFGGGGHFAASGCVIEGSLEDVKRKVSEKVMEALSSVPFPNSKS